MRREIRPSYESMHVHPHFIIPASVSNDIATLVLEHHGQSNGFTQLHLVAAVKLLAEVHAYWCERKVHCASIYTYSTVSNRQTLQKQSKELDVGKSD